MQSQRIEFKRKRRGKKKKEIRREGKLIHLTGEADTVTGIYSGHTGNRIKKKGRTEEKKEEKEETEERAPKRMSSSMLVNLEIAL